MRNGDSVLTLVPCLVKVVVLVCYGAFGSLGLRDVVLLSTVRFVLGVRRAEVDTKLVYTGSIEGVHAMPWTRGIRRCALCVGMADIQFVIIQGSCDI